MASMNTVVISGLVLLAATWNCYISYISGYVGLLVLHLLPLLNHWLKCSQLKSFPIGINLADVHLNWLHWFHFLVLERGLLVILIDCMIFLSTFLDVKRMSVSTVSFLSQLDSEISAYRTFSFDL